MAKLLNNIFDDLLDILQDDPNYNIQIINLRTLLQDFLEIILINSNVNNNTKDLDQLINLVIKTRDINTYTAKKLHSFRKFANDVAHQQITSVSKRDYNKRLKQVCQFIEEIGQEPLPDKIKSLINETNHLLIFKKYLIQIILMTIIILIIIIASIPKEEGNQGGKTHDSSHTKMYKSFKNIHIIAFEPVSSNKVIEKLRTLKVKGDLNTKFVIKSVDGIQFVDIDSINYSNFSYTIAKWNNASHLFKSTFESYLNDTIAANTIVILGNIPEIPNESRGGEDLILAKDDFKKLNSKGHLKFLLITENKNNAETEEFYNHILKKQKEGFRFEIEKY